MASKEQELLKLQNAKDKAIQEYKAKVKALRQKGDK